MSVSSQRRVGRQTTGSVGKTTASKIGNGRSSYQQRTIDKWQRETDKLEASFARYRARPHAFIPMGKLPACATCGLNKGQEWQGRVVHGAS